MSEHLTQTEESDNYEPYMPVSSQGGSVAKFFSRVHRYQTLFKRFWWILFLTTSLGLGWKAYESSHQPPRFASSGKMMVSGRISLPEGAIYSEELSNFFGTQIELMQSIEVRQRAQERLKALNPNVQIPLPDEVFLSVNQAPQTSIFVLSVISPYPEYSQLYLDCVMESFLDFKREQRSQTTDVTASAISEELVRLERELAQAEEKVIEFQKDNNIVFIQEQASSAGSYLVNLNSQLAELKKEYQLLGLLDVEQNLERLNTAQINKETQAGSHLIESVKSQGEYLKTKQRIQMLKAEHENLGRYLKPAHPKMIRLAEEIDRQQRLAEILQSQTISQMVAMRETIGIQIENLKKVIEEWEQKSLGLSQKLAEYQRLNASVERTRNLYNRLLTSIQNVDLNKSIEQENIGIIENASPASPLQANIVHSVAVGGGLGFLIGAILLFGLSRIDDRINSVSDLDEWFTEPVRGHIPKIRTHGRNRRISLLKPDDTRHVFAESYRNVRSALLYMDSSENRPKVILITSALPGEGKSTVAANLACTMAFSGSKTLLVDADLRRGVSHELFHIADEPGLAEFLEQEISWKEAVVPSDYENLFIIPKGFTPSRPGELLLGNPIDIFLEEARREYDYIIIDSAPVLATDDTSSLAPKLDGVMFVIRAQLSTVRSVRTALDTLYQRKVKMLGMILNSADFRQPGYYYQRYYDSYYLPTEKVRSRRRHKSRSHHHRKRIYMEDDSED